ncbi:hypothetical protein ABT187_47745 [Streptomyces sp. NPDC001817]|uniref:class I SAM-dependent methyltransferase n=1 Tax=Streptomyces sp. NPDC001817 TaxID=3154398 RepID=UPI00331FC1BF
MDETPVDPSVAGGPSPAPGGGRYGTDLFAADQREEGERIDYGALAYDPATRGRLTALGVGPGWRCLDVAAGTGTISRWLADEVGVEEVLALDRDPRFVHARPGSVLRTLAADITDPALAPGRVRSGPLPFRPHAPVPVRSTL